MGALTRSYTYDEFAPVAKTFAQVQQAWLMQPAKLFDAQLRLWQRYVDLWSASALRAQRVGNAPAARYFQSQARRL
jgi:hypothetical protein